MTSTQTDTRQSRRVARAFAPACVGNVAVGFDILGHTVAGMDDGAEVRRIDEPVVRIAAIHGEDVKGLPTEPSRNTAGAALIALREALALDYGFEITLYKNIPLGSGMGGSAASSVAALVAANALLDEPLPPEALYPYTLAGEAAASGGQHGDNVGPMLLGGVVLATHNRLLRIPVPDDWYCALVHPHHVVETRKAREALAGAYELKEFVAQSSNLALVLSGCFRGDAALVRAGLNDTLIEPRRAKLVPHFAQAKEAALSHNALGGGMSGAGPSIFGWYENKADAQAAAKSISDAFRQADLDSDILIAPVNGPAAALTDDNEE